MQSVTSNAVANLSRLKNLSLTSDLDVWTYFANIATLKVNGVLMINYEDSTIFSSLRGNFVYSIGDDTNIVMGLLFTLYTRKCCYVELNIYNRTSALIELT